MTTCNEGCKHSFKPSGGTANTKPVMMVTTDGGVPKRDQGRNLYDLFDRRGPLRQM